MMRAAVYERFQEPISVQHVDMPTPRPDSAVIRVEACGICRSDWHGWMGHDSDVRLPHVPGHELAGIVAEVGAEVRSWQPGARITVPFCCGCGTCAQCAAGHHQICDNYTQPGFTHWGAFAEFVEIRHADVNLVPLPENVDSVTAASLGCRFATSFRGVVQQGRVTKEDVVAVFGCGGVGLSAVMIAKSLKARVVAIDLLDSHLQKAIECGADHTVNAGQVDDVVAAVTELTAGGATVSLDAFGSRRTCYQSIACLRKRGRHVQIGLTLGKDADPAIPMSAVVAKELEIVGSHGMAAFDYRAMMRLVQDGILQPQQLITERVSLQQACQRLMNMNSFSSTGVVVIDRF